MDYRVETLRREIAYRGFLRLDTHRLRHASFHGGWCEPIVRERLEGLSAVSVLLYDPDADAVVLVEQFRVGLLGQVDPPWSLETVSGFCDRENESPETVARREVVEETGCELRALTRIGRFFVSPGISVEQIHLYCGRVDSRQARGVHGLPEEGEEIRVVVMPREQAMEALFARIDSTSVLIALQWLQLNRASLLREWDSPRTFRPDAE
jgi:ADP-ribose pyrophosphatase